MTYHNMYDTMILAIYQAIQYNMLNTCCISYEDGTDMTLLMLAVQISHEEAVQLICKQQDCNVNIQNSRGETALSYSLIQEEHDIKIIQCLLEHGANPNMTIRGETLLLRSFVYDTRNQLQAFWLLHKYGASLNMVSTPNPLGIAIMQGKTELMLQLLEHGASLNVPNQFGLTPMGNVACTKYTVYIDILRSYGGDLLLPQGNGDSILMMAAQAGSASMLWKIIQELKFWHADKLDTLLHQVNFDNKTPLIHAIESGSSKKVHILLEAGVNVNQPELLEKGRYVILHAIRSRNLKIVRMLLRAKVFINQYIISSISKNKSPIYEKSIQLCYREYDKRMLPSILKTTSQTRSMLMMRGIPFDIALDISQRSIPKRYMSAYIQNIDKLRAISAYHKIKNKGSCKT